MAPPPADLDHHHRDHQCGSVTSSSSASIEADANDRKGRRLRSYSKSSNRKYDKNQTGSDRSIICGYYDYYHHHYYLEADGDDDNMLKWVRSRYSTTAAADNVLRPLITLNARRLFAPSSSTSTTSIAAAALERSDHQIRNYSYNSYHRRSIVRGISWLSLLVVIFSFAALSVLVKPSQCQSIVDNNNNSGTEIHQRSSMLIDHQNDHQDRITNRKERESSVIQRPRTARHRHRLEEIDQQRKLSKSDIRQLSRMAFKALISEDFQDKPLRAPPPIAAAADDHDRDFDNDDGGDRELEVEVDESTLTAEGRRQIRRQQRKLERQRQREREREKLEAGDDLLPPASDFINDHDDDDVVDNGNGDIDDRDDRRSSQSNRQQIPGRRRAIAIATRDSIKPDSCRTVPLKQRVRMAGCTTKIVVNHFCYGQCNSFFIPKLTKRRLRPAFESCSVCRPKSYVPVSVTLHCPSAETPYVKRKIMKVKECSCMPAHINDNDIPQP